MRQIKKVLFILSIYKPNMGGVETSVESYCREYNKRGIKTVVLTKQYPKDLPNYDIYDETPVFRILKPETDNDYMCFLDQITSNPELRADVIHVVGVRRPLPLFALLLAHKLNVPCLMTFVGGDVAEGPIWEERKIDSINSIKQSDGYSAYSEAIVQDARNLVGITSAIPVVKTGINLEKIASIAPINDSSDFILCARRLVYDKGVDILISAFATITSRFPNLKLYIAGEGEERDKLESLSNELNIADKIVWLGTIPLDTLYAYMKRAIAHICPSRSEGGGNVNIEASACACVPIGSNIGGISEYITDNQTGLLFKPEDSDDLAQKIYCLLENPDIRTKLIENGLHFANNFSIEKQTDRYLGIYKSLKHKSEFVPWSELTQEMSNVIKKDK